MNDNERRALDVDLFGPDPTPAPAPGIDPADIEKAGLILTMLRGAGLKPVFGLDQDIAEEVWAVQLRPYPAAVLIEVVQEWIDAPGDEFPTVGDVTTMAQRNLRRAAAVQRGLERRVPGQVCPECEDDGYVDAPGLHGNTAVKPCGTCRPERRAAHEAGCDMTDHVSIGGCPRCNPTKRRRAS